MNILFHIDLLIHDLKLCFGPKNIKNNDILAHQHITNFMQDLHERALLNKRKAAHSELLWIYRWFDGG